MHIRHGDFRRQFFPTQSDARPFFVMPKSKSPRKNKKYRPMTGRVPVGLMHKLDVPEDRIQALKQKQDAALLRLYMGSANWQDHCEIYSVLRFGESLCKHIKDGEAIAARLREAMHVLAKEPELAENGRRNLDLVRDALDLVEGIWRVVTVEEFVRAAQALKVEEVEQWKKVRLTKHGVEPIAPEEQPTA